MRPQNLLLQLSITILRCLLGPTAVAVLRRHQCLLLAGRRAQAQQLRLPLGVMASQMAMDTLLMADPP